MRTIALIRADFMNAWKCEKIEKVKDIMKEFAEAARM